MMMQSMCETIIIFDLDDTLYKEIDFVKSAYSEICTRIQRKYTLTSTLCCEELMDIFFRGENVFEYVNKISCLNIPIETYLSWYRLHKPEIHLSEETKSVLSFLKENQWIIGLITDGRSVTQRNKIEALSLNHFIEKTHIVISEEFGSEKPSLANYEYFMKLYPNAKRFIYVGDNVKKDFITPNQIGWTTIGLIDDGRNIHKQNISYSKEYLPTYWISEFQEIIPIIQTL